LTAQLMSHSVASVMKQYSTMESLGTAKFIALVDQFFDCMNTRSLDEGARKHKPLLAPYWSLLIQDFSF